MVGRCPIPSIHHPSLQLTLSLFHQPPKPKKNTIPPKSLGYDLEALADAEQNAALGNGGLGRLAACFLDSMATLDLPGWGCGIRYRYGMFRQAIGPDGRQAELPDVWLTNGNPWEVKREGVTAPVGFYGSVDAATGKWAPAEVVTAQAYDCPVPGYDTPTVGNLRLWDALPASELDLAAFNEGRFVDAVASARSAAEITAVLYPNDATEEGKLLRLKQQYFFVSASIQDVLTRFKATPAGVAGDWEALPDYAIFQMNDTHPTCAVSELMRLLVDGEGLAWDRAWAVTRAALAFTNHTVMPEALEKWPVSAFSKLLPRNYEIVARIDAEWRASLAPKVEAEVRANPPPPLPPPEKVKKDEKKTTTAGAASSSSSSSSDDSDAETTTAPYDPAAAQEAAIAAAVDARLARTGVLVEEPWAPGVKLINMAHLAIVGSSAVNGVAAIHSEILKADLFADFYALTPAKFQNKTNGVTPRRWLAVCNPGEAALITRALGTDAWVRDASLLAGLRPWADDPAFRADWRAVKQANKARLAAKVKELTGVSLPTSAMFDVHIKRIHEYKRQLMNILSVIARYQAIKTASPAERAAMVPRAVIFGGKAASAYRAAKKIVRLITAVAAVVNADPEVGDLLKVVFLPDYNVSLAETIIPAAELSQHISTAGTEASGTSNMKFAMNGSLIIGTMDGANIEIAEAAGAENLFIFGVDAEDVPRLRRERAGFQDYDAAFLAACAAVKAGEFGDADYLAEIIDNVTDMSKGNDWFLVANDAAGYAAAQGAADDVYRDQDEWTRRSIVMAASSGGFSSDRTIAQYASEIWGVVGTRRPE
jgi:glycogen phosphorylase